MHKKWIIYRDLSTNQKIFRLGVVDLHRDLLPKTEAKCLGGGKFEIDNDANIIYLYGRSIDFGCVSTKEFTEDLWIQSPGLKKLIFKFSNLDVFSKTGEWETIKITEDNF